MADVIASGNNNPWIRFRDSSSNNLWRIRHRDANSAMQVQEYSGGWDNRFILAGSFLKINADFTVERANPSLLFVDGGTDNFRVQNVNEQMFIQHDDSGWEDQLMVDDQDVYIRNSLAAGSDDTDDHEVWWEVHHETFGSSTSTETITFSGQEQIVGALVSITKDTGDVHQAVDFRMPVVSGEGWSCKVTRDAAGDEVTVTKAFGTWGMGEFLTIIAFFEP